MESKRYIEHINGLKGFACLLVMIGHFLGIYKYSQEFVSRIRVLDALQASPLSFLIDEGYWLYLFFVVSGYLVAKSKIASISDVFYQSIRRLLRFVFPVFFACLLIYGVYFILGFHNAETAGLFQCNWYQADYSGSFSMIDVIAGPVKVLFLGETALNSPYWVLRGMYIASIMIYILKYVYGRLHEKHGSACFSLLLVITCAAVFIAPMIAACLIGMMISLYETTGMRSHKKCFPIWIIVCAMMLYVLPKSIVAALFFAALVIYIPDIRWMNSIFSSPFFQFIGKICWGIYSFHWPMICSIGGIMMIALAPKIGLRYAYLLSCMIAALLTIALSVANYYTFDAVSKKLSKKTDGILGKVFNI